MPLTRSNKENEEKKNRILGITPKAGDKPHDNDDEQQTEPAMTAEASSSATATEPATADDTVDLTSLVEPDDDEQPDDTAMQTVTVEGSDPSAFNDEFDELARMVETDDEGNLVMADDSVSASEDLLAERLTNLEPLVGVVPEMTRENMAEYLDDWHELSYAKSDEYQEDLRKGREQADGTFNTVEPVYAYRIYRGSMLASFKSAISSEFLLLQEVQDAISRIDSQVTIVEAKQMMGLGKGTKTIAVKVL